MSEAFPFQEAPVIDWDAPNDGETTAEMLAVAAERRIADEITAERQARAWRLEVGEPIDPDGFSDRGAAARSG